MFNCNTRLLVIFCVFQKTFGHSSLAVSLTYLRGLEVSELKEEDMPMI